MSFDEFLRKEYEEKKRYHFNQWMDDIWPKEWIDIATSWNKAELAKMVPSEDQIIRILDEERQRNSTMGQPHEDYTTIKYRQAKALHKFLEERSK